MDTDDLVSVILGEGTVNSLSEWRADRAEERSETARLAEVERRVVAVCAVGDEIVRRIAPPLRMPPRDRDIDPGKGRENGESITFRDLWFRRDLNGLFAAELAAGDFTRWETAGGGGAPWSDERAHFENVSRWAKELRSIYGPLLSVMYQVLLNYSPSETLGTVTARLGLPEPEPTMSLTDIADFAAP